MIVMDYRPLLLRCQCGQTPSRIDEIGFSADRQLVIHWWCGSCWKLVYTSMPLTDCWQACPRGEVDPQPVPVSADISAPAVEQDDTSFLRSLGVRYLRDGEG
jgi:hypothetical protein